MKFFPSVIGIFFLSFSSLGAEFSLVAAAKGNNIQKIKILLIDGIPLDQTDEDGVNAIMIAVETSNINMLSTLIYNSEGSWINKNSIENIKIIFSKLTNNKEQKFDNYILKAVESKIDFIGQVFEKNNNKGSSAKDLINKNNDEKGLASILKKQGIKEWIEKNYKEAFIEKYKKILLN